MCEIARSQVALMAKFAKFKRLRRLIFAKFAMRAAWLRAISHTTPARHYTFPFHVLLGYSVRYLVHYSHYCRYCGGTNRCTIWLKTTPKLHQNARKNATHRWRAKLAAALRAAANFGRLVCRVFPHNFGVIFNQIVQRFVHPQYANF